MDWRAIAVAVITAGFDFVSKYDNLFLTLGIFVVIIFCRRVLKT